MTEWHLSEDMEGFENFTTLEVNSVVDLIVSIADEMLDAELADVQHAFGAMAGSSMAPLHEAVETRALVEADARRRVSSPAGDTAGASMHCKHVAGDGWSVRGFDVSVGSTAGTLVGTHLMLGYGSPRCTVASLVDLMSVSVQTSVPETPPEARGRHMDWLLTAFLERLLGSSHWGKHPSAPRQLLSPPVTVSAHMTTTTTTTTC